MRNFYRQHKTTRERIDNLAQRLTRKAGRKVSSREVLEFAESRKFFPEIISGHRCFPIGVADIIFEEMPLEVPAQVEAPAVEQPEGVLPGFPAPAPVQMQDGAKTTTKGRTSAPGFVFETIFGSVVSVLAAEIVEMAYYPTGYAAIYTHGLQYIIRATREDFDRINDARIATNE